MESLAAGNCPEGLILRQDGITPTEITQQNCANRPSMA